MKGKFRNKIIGSCMVIVCLVAILFVKGILTEASDTTTEEIQLVTITNYTSSALEAEISNQRANNYLYAGLYKSGTTEDTLVAKNVVIESKVTEGSTYVAKFLPEGVMGIKAQVSEALLSNPEATTSSVRFVTAVDSVLYKEVGFSITREGDTEGADPIQLVKEGTISKYVYEKLYGVDVTSANPGEPLEYTPKDIHALANYFKTYTVTNVPEEAYNKDLTVTPYWITYDGVTVEGTTGIKSVNFGRSWVYINTSANTDGDQYGTYDHPYTDLADALDAIVLDRSGKIVMKTCSTITLASTFTWSEHGKDITITGEGEKTETLDFSAITNFRMGDSVTFENMTLNLPTGQLYCNGHRFQVSENVISNNSGLIIFGGDNKSNVIGDTSVTLLSGSYEAVYGGGVNTDVEGDTHVTIQNVNIYDTESNKTRFVFGGGRKGNVTGNTYVTVGTGFNTEHDWENDSYLSAIFGGGYGADGSISTVKGNTYVVVKDGAKTNYVHGAGMSYSTVEGTSYVTFDGGYAMCIYGGGSSKQISNGDTHIEMKSGTVEQIFGGNQNGMTGNADVHVLGGTILRRVYAGCYNNYYEEIEAALKGVEAGWQSTNEVNGYVSVTFGPDTYATLAESHSEGDCAYLASSRYDSTTTEKGVFVLNDYNVAENPNVSKVGKSTYFTTISPYHYLVKSTTGGAVYSEGDSIRVVPDENKVATVRVDSAEEGDGTTVLAYLTGEGVCKLPAYDSTVDVQNVYVVFTDKAPNDVGKYKATADGMSYTTLEDAINAANTMSTTTGKEVVVNLLQENITVDSTLNIAETAKIKIQNAEDVTATVNRADGLMSSNLLNVADGATLTVKGIVLDGRKTDELTVTDMDSIAAGSASLIKVSGDLIIDGATIQYAKNSVEGSALYVAGGNVTMNGGSISNNYALGKKSGGAVSLNNSSAFTMEDGTISYNTAEGGSGGAFIVRTSSELKIEDGTISYNEATVSGTNGGGAIFAHHSTTVNITGGIMSYNKAVSGNGGAILAFKNDTGASNVTIQNVTILNNTSKNGGAIYVVAGAGLTLNGGVRFTENSATECGDDIYLDENIITLKKALSDSIVVGPSSYEVGKVIAVNDGITEDEFKASMEKITVDAYKGEYWSVDANGALQADVVLDGVSYANLDTALANVAEESTITLYQNQELSSPVTVEGTLTITCADSVSIMASESFSGNMFTVTERGNLVITGVATDKRVTLVGRNVAKYGIQSNGTLELTHTAISNVAQQGVRINIGTATLNSVDIKTFGTYGLVVKNGTVIAKNILIDNAGVTETTANRIGIAAHGGELTLDNVTVQNLVGNNTYKANHGIDHQGGQLIVTANETVDGGNKGLYIYNVRGHGIYSQSGSMNISQIIIDGKSQTRAGIQLTGNTSNDNKVSNATITGCSVQIQLKNASLWIESTFVEETTNTATNYKTDGTKQ